MNEDAKRILDNVPGLVATMTPRGELEFLNQPLIDYLGLSSEDQQRWTFNDIVHAEDRARVVDVWTQGVANGEEYEIEHRIRRVDGDYRWLRVRGRPERDASNSIVRWYVALSDIHELKSAEANLQRSERELSLIIETIPAYSWCGGLDGAITYISQRILDFFGWTFDEIAHGWPERVHPDDREGTIQAWGYSVSTGTPMSVTHRLRRQGGDYRWMVSKAQLGHDESGQPTRWYGLLVDIDDHQRAEETLSEMRARLNRASQIAAVAELAASIAHEINQPLSAVVSNGVACTNWLDSQPPNLEKAHRAAECVVRDGTQAGDIVSRLQALFKRGTPNRVLLSMNELIRDVLDVVRREASRRNVQIRSELAADLPQVEGDRVQLQQLVLNLVSNALDAMDGVVTRPKLLTVRTIFEPPGQAAVEVTDTGVGFDEPNKLFESFFTTKSQGMGMGLAISRSIVEAHTGRLWATKGEAHGATFHFSLPLRRQV